MQCLYLHRKLKYIKVVLKQLLIGKNVTSYIFKISTAIWDYFKSAMHMKEREKIYRKTKKHTFINAYLGGGEFFNQQ